MCSRQKLTCVAFYEKGGLGEEENPCAIQGLSAEVAKPSKLLPLLHFSVKWAVHSFLSDSLSD